MIRSTCVATFAAALLVANGPAQASEALDKVVASYLEIHSQLAADKVDGIKAPASAVATAAAGMGDAGRDISAAAKAVEGAADINAAREAFGTLSDAVIAAAKAEDWKGLEDVKLAYCPMAKKSWLQKEDAIRNPYYGTQMPTCGSFKDPRAGSR